MADFEERCGIVRHQTSWGEWCQSLEDLSIEAALKQGTKGKEVQVNIYTSPISVLVREVNIIEGILSDPVNVNFSTRIVDRKLLTILLVKAGGFEVEFRPSLVVGEYQPDLLTLNLVRKKLDLERYREDNLGFELSAAEFDVKYEDEAFLMDSAGIPNPSELEAAAEDSVNRTDDQKLDEARSVQQDTEMTDDMKNADLSREDTVETDEEKSVELP